MYNAETNEIYFPHIIAGNVLGGKTHTFNSINSGMKMIGDFNLIRNKFFGGLVTNLGLIGEYGFFACPHYAKPTLIVGFYIPDPNLITELGRKLIKEKYPTANIVYEIMTTSPHRELTKEDLEKKKSLIEQAVKNGSPVYEITDNTVDELETLLRIQKTGLTDKKVVVEDTPPSKDDSPVVVLHKRKR
jgi:hypothetical protein